MKIVAAIDSFKGSLSSVEAGQAVREGILSVMPEASVVVKALADGGEGTVDALIQGMGGQEQMVTVTGPMGKLTKARYGIIDVHTAVMEMAMASGITLVPLNERNPMEAGTCGVGEMIRDAIEKGCRSFIIGIGGSATNDGGLGMLQALGYRFLSTEGKEVVPAAKGLMDIAVVDESGKLPELSECSFRIACDVKNPLCGENGASYVFGPQKGANALIVKALDAGLSHFAAVTAEHFGRDVSKEPGTGAAGGLGFAFLAYLKGKLEPGIDIVLDTISLEAEIKDADIVVTGEGRLDAQTVMGKTPAGVAKLAKKYGCTVIAVAGCAAKEAAVCNDHGIDAYFPILQEICTVEKAMDKENAKSNMVSAARQIFGLVKALKMKQ